MSLSIRKHLVYSLLLLICFNLNNGCALDLNCSQTRNCSIQASQSSTYLTRNASRAVDGDPTTHSETNATHSKSAGWWKVYLGDIYCLRNIIVDTKESGMQGAVLRAGLNSNYSQNIMIGAPFTSDQNQSGLVVNLTVDPIVIAQYVSVEQTFNSVAIGELMVEEITESGDTSAMPMGVDLTLVTKVRLVGQSVNNEAVIKAYKGCSDLTANVSFGRQLTTGGSNTGLPVGFTEADDPILGRAARSLAFPGTSGMDRVGVFYSEASKGGRSTRIQTIILPSDDTAVHIRPEQRSLTVSAGESVTLHMINKNSPTSNYRWKHNGTAKDEWNNQLNVSIPSVNKTDEGIYSCFVDGQEDQQLHGIMRLIVRDCPSEMWGPPMCTNTCRRCYNGGICDDKTGTCVCAPGFSGESCIKVHGRHVFGKDAQYKCSKVHDPHNTACQGHLFCLPDPYGCSCAAGFMGLDCNTACSDGMYGADCTQTCHCKIQYHYLKDTGECNNGDGGECESSYFGKNCQCSTGNNVLGLQVLIEDSFSLRVTWQPDICFSNYTVEYELINTNMDPCEDISSPERVSYTLGRQANSHLITGLVTTSTYNVYIRPIFNGVNGTESSVSRIILANVTAPTASPSEIVSTSVNQRSLSFSWSAPPCESRGGPITWYTYKLSGSVDDVVVNQSRTSSKMVTIQGLTPYTNYSFQVAANTSAGIGPFSDVVNVRTQEGVPPQPVNFRLINADETSITVEWTAPDPPHGLIINYDISYWESTAEEPSISTNSNTDETSFSYVIAGLTTNVTYSIKVRAKTSAGYGEWSIIINGTAKIGVPGPVVNFRSTNQTEMSITLEWDQPLNPNGQVKQYVVEYRALEKLHQVDFTAGSEYVRMEIRKEQVTLNDLEPTTKYEFKISAQNQHYTGNATVLLVYTKPLESPPEPPAPTANQNKATDKTITINLTPFDDDTVITSYVIRVKRVISETKREALVPIHYNESQNDYIAAEIGKKLVHDSFVVGDGKMYGGYGNVPLHPVTKYSISVGSVSRGNGTDAFVTFSEPVTATTQAPGSPAFVGALVAGVIVVTILIVVIVLYLRRRQDSQPGKAVELTGLVQPAGPSPQGSNDNAAVTEETSPVCIEAAVAETPTPSTTQLPVQQSPLIRVEELEGYIQMKNSAGPGRGFDADYKTLPDGQLHPWTVARKPENKTKNRYANVIAYDHSRVVLEPLENDPHSDYINACYIDGYKAENKYIASQGPNKESIKDIWRMIWQQNVDKIVMLTNPVEEGKMKCLQYWADEGSCTYSGITVTTVKEDVYRDHTVRLFNVHEVAHGKSNRLVKQFHYKTWPDMVPPEYPTPLLNFLRVVNAHQNSGRLMIHCSAGVGRTGTYITLDAMLEQIKQEGQVDVLGFIHKMRDRRIKTVQTAEQYKFLYDAILEGYLTEGTTYHVTEYRRRVAALKKTGIERQFVILGRLCGKRLEKSNKSGKLPENVAKNRFPDFIPSDRARPYLTTVTSDEDTNYINGTCLPGYRKKNMYIATQMPMPNTKADIWRLVYDHKVTCIVMLNQYDEDDETMCKYWPEAEPLEYGDLVVELLETTEYDGVIGHSFSLRSKALQSDPARTVCQFQYLDWPSDQDVPTSFGGLLKLIDLTEQWHKSNVGPIVVHCNDGLGRSSAFCALMTLLEKFKEEMVVNVLQEVITFRMVNSKMMYSLEHYAMCYDVILAYMNNSSENTVYENLSG